MLTLLRQLYDSRDADYGTAPIPSPKAQGIPFAAQMCLAHDAKQQ